MCYHSKKLIGHFGYLFLLNKPLKKFIDLNNNWFTIFYNSILRWALLGCSSAPQDVCCWYYLGVRLEWNFWAGSYRWLAVDAGCCLGDQWGLLGIHLQAMHMAWWLGWEKQHLKGEFWETQVKAHFCHMPVKSESQSRCRVGTIERIKHWEQSS